MHLPSNHHGSHGPSNPRLRSAPRGSGAGGRGSLSARAGGVQEGSALFPPLGFSGNFRVLCAVPGHVERS